MELNEIRDPAFLKTLNNSQLKDLAEQIRTFLIYSLSKTGGHLASNLGIVELTIALHYVFDSPKDKIIFDVGHQSYVHKILTGRADRFSTLRQYKGLSGFQKRSESAHDVWEAGHSSTSLSAALGMAVARDLNKEDYSIIPVIGDGAISNGLSLEALNEIGVEKRNIIIIFNDNNMSISKNVGAMNAGFSKLRTLKSYTTLKSSLKRSLSGNPIGDALYKGLKVVKDSMREAVIDGGIFEEFGLDYMGPVDGHNIHDLIQILETAKHHRGPTLIHVMTKKGKGYSPCEEDSEGHWHGVGPFNIETGKPLHEVPCGFSAWGPFMSQCVAEFAQNDKDIVSLTPAMINGSGMGVLFAKYPDRSFDTGIAEEHTATFAAGLAISGKKPYMCIYSSFLQRAYDEINHDICRMDLPVVIGIDHAGLVGGDGETHQGTFDIGILSGLPNMIISHPKDAQEAKDLLYTAFNQKHPFAVRFPKGEVKTSSVCRANLIPIGQWELLHDSPENKVVIITYGDMVNKLFDKVVSNNLPVTIVNARYIKPLDYEMIQSLVERKLKLFVYEQDYKTNGLGSLILQYLNELEICLPIKIYGLPDKFIPQGTSAQLRKEYHIDMNTFLADVQQYL